MPIIDGCGGILDSGGGCMPIIDICGGIPIVDGSGGATAETKGDGVQSLLFVHVTTVECVLLCSAAG